MTPVTDRVPERADESRPRNRFAFFGQLNPYKGSEVLLQAVELLEGGFDGHVWIFGANLEIQPIELRERVAALVERNRDRVTFAGAYRHSELPKLMAGIDWVVVPSVWWETGPIVVLEAFQHGRPVICSDIGGMSEKVTDGVSGLHFRTGDARHLAEVMTRAMETPGLWEKLREGIPADPPRWMADHVQILGDLYKELLALREPAVPPVETAVAP
jgi:glycosyltransferase involved in cell wall biosynthesis